MSEDWVRRALTCGLLAVTACGGAAAKTWPPQLQFERIKPSVDEPRRYFGADHLAGTTREYRYEFLGEVESRYLRYELGDSSSGKVLTEYDLAKPTDRSPTETYSRYLLADTGVKLLEVRGKKSQTKIYHDVFFSWSAAARPFWNYELETTATGRMALMPLSVSGREKTMGVLDGFFRVTGAGGVAFEALRVHEATGVNVTVNEDGLVAGGEKTSYTYYGLDFGRLVTTGTTEPTTYGETAATLIDGAPAVARSERGPALTL